MPVLLDDAFTRSWYDRLPHAFRDLDTTGDLLGFLRVLGDYAGGLAILADVLEGIAASRTIELGGPPALAFRIEEQSVLWADGTLDPATHGLRVVEEYPIIYLDSADEEVLVANTDDWLLSQPVTIPAAWVKWVAQVLSSRLMGMPERLWREWIESPDSRLSGSLSSIQHVASWHVLDTVTPVVERDPGDLWSIAVTVPALAITTTLADLEDSLALVEPAGARITVVTT